MELNHSQDDNLQDQSLPLPIQIFLWSQVSPFIRPKLGKHHEATCTELKEACKSFEKVLVQNISYGLSPSLTNALRAIPRWRLIQAAFPHVMHCAANLLHNRKDTNLQNLGATETKMLYTLHWIILLAAEECADADHEAGIYHSSPFYYLFSIPSITLFIHLFAPIFHHLKESDFQTFRLESGLKMWQALWEYRHPDTPCFTAHVNPKPRALWHRFIKDSHLQFGDVFLGRQQSGDDGFHLAESPLSASGEYKQDFVKSDEEGPWVSSPKDTAFPETIPEESSSTEEEHVVIFRLPSISEGDVCERSASLFTTDSLFQMTISRPSVTIEEVKAVSGSDQKQQKNRASSAPKIIPTAEKDSSGCKSGESCSHKINGMSHHAVDINAATFLDVAVLRCLFMSQWPEEGVFWALQFYYHRLREMSEESFNHQVPRKRSNSLPIPKIEISLYQSPEMKKKDSAKDFIELPEEKDSGRLAESPYFGRKSDDSLTYIRRASEKSSKKKKKIADLRAFVETKLLSKSERTLIHIGQDEPQSPFIAHQDHHHSLDTGDDHLTRPASILFKNFESTNGPLCWGSLVKGKSMPSLRYVVEQEMKFAAKNRAQNLEAHSHPITNPIITVTEHSPLQSPDYMKKHVPSLTGDSRDGSSGYPNTRSQLSIDSQVDDLSLQGKQEMFTMEERKPSLTRSHTDSNITYSCEDLPQAPGATYYITKNGDIDIQVVLKAVHSVAMRTNVVCTLRVCEVIFNLLEILMEMGVLKELKNDEDSNENNNHKEQEADKDVPGSDPKETKGNNKTNEKHLTPHNLLLNTIMRVFRHLGCPHGCADGLRGPPVEFLRSQGQNILLRMYRLDEKQFSAFLRKFVRDNSLPDILEFFHAYLGFCVDPTSLLSPLNQKRSSSKSPDVGPQGGYSTNFDGGSRGVENHVLTSVFRTLVTRLVKASKELKAQENVPLYCDVRQLMTYVKEAHGGVFRRVALSGLLDSISSSDKGGQNHQTHTTRVIRRIPQTDLPSEDHETAYYMDEKGQKKVLLKKRSMSSCVATTTMTSESDAADEWTSKSQSPIGNVKKRFQPTLTPRQSEKNLTNLMPSTSRASSKMDKPKLIPKIGGIVSWFKKEHGRTDSMDSHDDGVDMGAVEAALQRSQSVKRVMGKVQSKDSSGDLKQALKKTKKQMEDKIKWNFGLKKGKKKDGSLEETAGTILSHRSSIDAGFSTRDSDYVIYRERKLVPLGPVLNGMMRFSFLLDTCQPGSVPDQHLLAAILDLPQAPIVARASLLLECAFFVHNCNKGQWPTWMKFNLPVFRPSMPTHPRGLPSGLRRTHILQKSAGRLFYQWAEALGSRLEEMLHEDRRHISDIVNMVTDESRQKQLLMEDEEEDFLDEASVNLSGKECPIALRMIACILLLEITAFLRETYQTLPKASRTSAKDRPPPWERMYSRDANRRWSMALSSMGHSQASAQSLQSIAGDAAGQAERKISFVLHEPDNESEGSSNTTVTMQGEDAPIDEKERERERKSISRASSGQHPARPLLLRRGTATNATGSIKRRSLKLRRNTKEGIKEVEIDFKRTDSIQSKRKVSSLSDRSDTSEPGGADISGEESPGVLSDDQPPESPSDSNETDESSRNMPWMKTVVQVAHSFNFYCSHQSFCHPFCYRRQMRACERLIRAVRKVYGEQSTLASTLDAELGDKEKYSKNRDKRGRKVSDHLNQQTSPLHRKGSLGKKDKIDLSKHRDSDQDLDNQAAAGKSKGSPADHRDTFPILRYLKTQVRNVFHAPLAVLVKGAVVLTEDLFIDILPVAWELLLEADQEVAASAASLFILCAVRAPNHASDLMFHGLSNQDVSVRINAILRFQVLWKLRYQVWPRMEEGANVTFKVPPPGIEFTLPSPKIGIESLPVVDPPWLPQVKTKVEEVTIRQDDHRFLVALTKTRRKQQMEMITMAMQAQENQTKTDRETFLITATPITVNAASQSSQIHSVGDDHDEGDEEQNEGNQGRGASHHMGSVQSLFPSCLCASVLQIINLLDDCAVSPDGCAVYEVAYSVIWNCLVEDSPLFLRYILERITREKQEQMFKVLRHLIRFVPKLPHQAAFSLYNYIIGYVMFYVRSSHEDGEQYIGTALSVLWMVVHSVHGIMFKDLKQILRKEQCDASILLTSNVPHAKRIVVHGPQEVDTGGIPSQFPVQEDTQFIQILRESLDFFGIEEDKVNEYFLVDNKTRQIHNPSSYVRDFYFFKRSQYPQLELVHMEPDEAFNGLQRQELIHKFVEIGKVLLTWAILKNVDMVVQRVVFLHEELMKLPSFPRKALESDLDLYKGGELGKELLGLDVLHKFMWVRLIARMFEAMAGNFAYSGDIHLFLNVLNGAIILHTEDSCILRYVVATYINAAHNFKNIFSTNGYLLIMPTLLQIYSNHQTNKLVTRTVEYCVKQFYLMNRKPFILQMFGSLSAILDTDEDGQYGDAHKVQAKCLFQLLLSLETPSPDPLNIGELVREEKPLKAIDFCYHDESEMVTVLDCISLCVMVIAYASDSVRGHQMLIILEAILPQYLQQIQKPSYEKEGKTEREIIQQLSSAVRTLIHNCEALGKSYNGPQRSSPEHKGSSQRNYSRGPYSPGFDFEEETRYISDHGKNKIHYDRDNEDSEGLRSEFRRPRDILLSLVADFYTKCSARLAEMPKKPGYDGKNFELLDLRSHLRLVDVAHSLLKVAPYDPDTMACTGLQRYMNDILPFTDWSNEAMRPALITILRRLDKTFSKIYKKPNIRRIIDWDAATGLLKGVYETLFRFPYIVHMQHLKMLINTCQLLILGDTSNLDISGTEPLVVRVLMSLLPPPHFCSISIKLILLQILAMGDNYSLEHVCGGTSVFPEKKKAENILMNLIMPLCLRVGSGRKDVPKMRPQDINFAVSIILHSMNPPANKIAPLTAQNIKSLTEMRSGSLAFSREAKKPVRMPQSTYQVAFLALKILIICFENELTVDWLRIAKTVREVGRIWDLGNVFWSFLDFVASQRTPLFVLLLPFMNEKVNTQPMNEGERHMQFVIREKLRGFSVPVTKCRAALLVDLAHEMKNLKEELENGKPVDDRDNTRSVDQMQSSNSGDATGAGHLKHHRPSIVVQFSGTNEAQGKLNAPSSEIQMKPLQSQRNSVTSVCEKTDARQPAQTTDDTGTTTAEEASAKTSSHHLKVSDKQRLFLRKPNVKLRFVSKVEMKSDSGETSMTPLSPGSPIDESSSEFSGQPSVRPKLQRNKVQSRKTFRLRRSQKSRLNRQETGQRISYSTPATPTEFQPNFLEQLKQQREIQYKQPYEKIPEPETKSKNIPETVEDDTSVISQTSSTSGYRESCSLITMTAESPTILRPSSSRDIVATTSPESSLASNEPEEEEETAILARSSSSQHSLLMLFEAQDEDTLI